MKRLTIELSDPEWERLQALAQTRSRDTKQTLTAQDCIRDFIRTCVPDGGTWAHPEKAVASE